MIPRTSQIIAYQLRFVTLFTTLSCLYFIVANLDIYANNTTRYLLGAVVLVTLLAVFVSIRIAINSSLKNPKRPSRNTRTSSDNSIPFSEGALANIRSAFGPIADSLDFVNSAVSDYTARIVTTNRKTPPRITVLVPKSRAAAFTDSLNSASTATDQTFFVIAHEIGHILYRDARQVNWLIAGLAAGATVLLGSFALYISGGTTQYIFLIVVPSGIWLELKVA